MGRENGVIYALGFFDGVHKGHQAILQETKAMGCGPGSLPMKTTPKPLWAAARRLC